MAKQLRLVSRLLALMSVMAAVMGFYRPWAFIDIHEPDALRRLKNSTPLGGIFDHVKDRAKRIAVTVKRGAETVTGDLPSLGEIPKQVSGVEIPRVANQEQAQVAMALMELVTNTRQDIGRKSYAVYLVPGLALLGGVLLLVLGRWAPMAWSLAALCAAIAGLAAWKLLTTNTHSLFVAITIGPGLWMSVWAYAGLALAGVLAGTAATTSRS